MKLINQQNNFHQLYKRSKKFDRYIRDSLDRTFNWTIGSVRSGKSTSNIVAFCMNLMLSPDLVHAAVGVSASTARAILFDGNGLGIKHFFKPFVREGMYENKEALIISLNGSERVVLAFGGANADDYKAVRGLSLGSVIMSEVDLLHPTMIEELFRRTMASKRRRIFIDNNAASMYHPIYDEKSLYSIERLRKTIPDKVNYMETTIFDNPSMTKEQIEDVLKEYDVNSLQYRRYILNERVIADDLIYKLYDWNTADSFRPEDISEWVISIDIGVNSSATAMVALGITKDNQRVIAFDDYYHVNKNERGMAVKTYDDYCNDAVDFLIRTQETMGGRPPRQIYIDHDVTFDRQLRVVLNRRQMGQYTYKYAIKPEIEDRIKTHINLLWTKRLVFTRNCESTLKAFREAQYDTKQSEKGKFVYQDVPGVTNIDPIDATSYAVEHFRRLLYRNRTAEPARKFADEMEY